jgi:hypothetical protein
MTRTAPRSTPVDGPVPQVESDPTDDALASVDDASTTFMLAAADQGAPRPPAVFTRLTQLTIGVGVAVLLLLEANEDIRALRRRTSHRLAERWADIERQERRDARRAVVGKIAAVAVRMTRQPN